MRGLRQDLAILQRNDFFWRYRLYDELPVTVVGVGGVIVTPGVVADLDEWNWEIRFAIGNEDGPVTRFLDDHFTAAVYSQEDDQRPWRMVHLTPAETAALAGNGVYQTVATHKTRGFRQEVTWGNYTIQKAVGVNVGFS